MNPLYHASNDKEFDMIKKGYAAFSISYSLKGSGNVCVKKSTVMDDCLELFPQKSCTIEQVLLISRDTDGRLFRGGKNSVTLSINNFTILVNYTPITILSESETIMKPEYISDGDKTFKMIKEGFELFSKSYLLYGSGQVYVEKNTGLENNLILSPQEKNILEKVSFFSGGSTKIPGKLTSSTKEYIILTINDFTFQVRFNSRI
jgi:hypothetical protein